MLADLAGGGWLTGWLASRRKVDVCPAIAPRRAAESEWLTYGATRLFSWTSAWRNSDDGGENARVLSVQFYLPCVCYCGSRSSSLLEGFIFVLSVWPLVVFRIGVTGIFRSCCRAAGRTTKSLNHHPHSLGSRGVDYARFERVTFN